MNTHGEGFQSIGTACTGCGAHLYPGLVHSCTVSNITITGLGKQGGGTQAPDRVVSERSELARTLGELYPNGWHAIADYILANYVPKDQVATAIQRAELLARIDELNNVPRYKSDDVLVADGTYYNKRLAELQTAQKAKEV